MGLPFFPQPKPESRKRVKGRRKRAETKVKKAIRPQVAARDGYCRLMDLPHLFGPCKGPSTWQHYNETRRSRTVGMPPERRHTTAGTMMNCRQHHYDIDENRIEVEDLTEKGADGPLRFRGGKKFDHVVYDEPERGVTLTGPF